MKILFFITALIPVLTASTNTSIPVLFQENTGQAPTQVQITAAVRGQPVWVTSRGITFRFASGENITLGIPAAKYKGSEEDAIRLNYFLTRDESEWKTNVKAWRKVRSATAWSGIDAVLYGSGDRLEYDFEIAPDADASLIRLKISGSDSAEVTNDGELAIRRGANLLVQHKPSAYQHVNGVRRQVEVAYSLQGDEIQFRLGAYDKSRTLVIDPMIDTASYIGGRGYDTANAVVLDAQGNAYVTGQTNTPAIATPGAAQETLVRATDAFVAKIAPGGQTQWITYFGGSGSDATGGGVDIGSGIALDSAGNIYVGGDTTSTNLPVSTGAFQRNFGGGTDDGFVLKLSPGGDRIIYATYIGGGADDFGNGIAVDAGGNAYLTGWTRSTDFPARNGFQTTQQGGGPDAFVVKLTPTGNALVYGTFLGGNGRDLGTGIVVDSTGAAYVTGSTSSSNFPIVNGFQRQLAGGILGDAFVTKLNPAGTALVFSTLLGGAETDQGFRLALDSSNNVVVTGYTESPNFPTRNPAQRSFGGTTDVFVTKLTASGNDLIFSTFLGGTGEDYGFGNVALDVSGAIYVTGWTASQNFPQISAAQRSFGGGKYDAFVTRIAPTGSAFLYSTFLGGRGEDKGYGLAIDASSRAVVVGSTDSPDFPGARNTIGTGGTDAIDGFIARLTADTSTGFISAEPASLTINVPASGGAITRTLRLTSAGTAINYSVQASVPWLIVNPPSGPLPQELTISIDPALLTPGTHDAVITVTAAGASNSPLAIPVTVNLATQPVITALEPGVIAVGASETPVTIRGSGFLNDAKVLVNNAEVGTVFVDANSLRAVIPASYFVNGGNLNIQVRNGNITSAVFNLPVSAGGPTINSASVVNAATNQPGAIAPGLLLNVFGTGFGPSALVPGTIANNRLGTSVGDVRVLIDGQAAPVLYAAPNQIGIVVPFEVAARPSVALVVESGGRQSTPVALNVAAAVPGVFTVDNTGRGQASVINEDSSVNSESSPAAKGSVITFYVTGAGVTFPVSQSGQVYTSDQGLLPRPELPLEVLIGGNRAEVLYAGGAPGLVAGVTQINVRIPAEANSGSAIPLVVRVAGVNSRLDATIAIR